MAAEWPARIEAAQLIHHYRIGGASYPRIRYGQEASDPWPDAPCHDCGVLKGQFHVEPVCDAEECPRCQGQVTACSCPYEEDNLA